MIAKYMSNSNKPSLHDFTGCILAGGFGTRLKECVSDKQKVLADVGGKPFMDYILNQFSHAGISKCILCTGYLSHQVEDHYGSNFNRMKLVYSAEKEPLGTAGAIVNAKEYIDTEYIIVANGDSYLDVNLAEFTKSYIDSGVDAMILLKELDNVARYGKIVIDKNNIIRNFIEKSGNKEEGVINAGIYYLKKSFIDSISPEGCISFEKDLFPTTVKQEQLIGIPCKEVFIDIGVPESYKYAQHLAKKFFYGNIWH